jgi:copper homeostasis protein
MNNNNLPTKKLLEVIGTTVETCILAQQAGADRIELCDNMKDGGTTPSLGFIQQARKFLHIPLYPIIRPRGGDFLYTHNEFEIMKADIVHCKNAGCDGVVVGILHADGTVDEKRNAILVQLAYPMEVTFHRAFDRTIDAFKALNSIINIGFTCILTSGQQPTALQGAPLIQALMQAANNNITIMPGSGIKSMHLQQLYHITGATHFHSSASSSIKSSMQYFNEQLTDLSLINSIDIAEVKAMKTILNQL